jgi:tetratricopeptide repeat protein
MLKTGCILLFAVLLTSPAFAEGFDGIQPASPFAPKPVPANTIALPIKKATLTHNSTHNQYVIAFNRFVQSNVKSAYADFKILIETMDNNDYAYMQMAEKMAGIGFFNLSDLAASKIDDKNLSDFLIGDVKLYYFPSSKLKIDDEIYLGEVFSNIIYNDQSREATAELVKNTPLLSQSDYANYIAALGYLKSNDIINAGVYIDAAIAMNPQNLNYKKLKAEILSQGKKPKNAIKMVDYIKSQKLYSADFTRKVNSLEQYVLYKSEKNYAEKMYHLGFYYYYENELAKSIRTLQSALTTKKKHNKDVYALMSRVYYDMQDYEKALDTALKAHKLDSNNSVALLVLGDLSFRDKDYKTALKYYRDAEANSKNSSICPVKVAQTYEQLGKEKKAFEIYEKILRTYSDCYLAYYKVALTDKSKEIAYLKKALAINANFKDAWIDLGRTAIERGNFLNAKSYLGVANYIDENDFRYYYYQGLIAKKQGMKQIAKSYFEKSLLLNPDYKPAKEELSI